MNNLPSHIPIEYLVYTILSLVVIGVILFRIIPKIYKFIEAYRKYVNQYDDIKSQIVKNTDDIQTIKQKIDRDYIRLNQLQNLTIQQQKYINESLEESEIILKSLLGIVRGLQEVGANGTTKKVEKELHDFLVKKSHKSNNNNNEVI